MIIVESAAICDYGRPLRIDCYTVEGDITLTLSSHDIFDELDPMIDEIDSFPLLTVEKAVEKYAFLINENRFHFLSMHSKAEEHCFILTNNFNTKNKQLKEMSDEMSSASTTSSCRTTRPSV